MKVIAISVHLNDNGMKYAVYCENGSVENYNYFTAPASIVRLANYARRQLFFKNEYIYLFD